MVSMDTTKTRKGKALRINYLQVVVCDREEVSLIDYFPDFYWFLENTFNANIHSHSQGNDQPHGHIHNHHSHNHLHLPKEDVKHLEVYKVDIEKKTNEKSLKQPVHEKFDHISQTTIKSESKNRVLVHCQMGRSRSATLVIMYIIYKQLVECCDMEFNYSTITKYVQQCRNVVDPNKGFLAQIEKFEQLVRSGEMTPKVRQFNRKESKHAYHEKEFDEEGSDFEDSD